MQTTENYTFLGWAVADDDGKLTFIDGKQQTITKTDEAFYYAVWAENRTGLTFGGTLTEGTVVPDNYVTVEENAGFAGFAGWYADKEFTTPIETLTTSTTVLYTRVYYTLIVNGEVRNLSGTGTSSEITINGAVQSTYSVNILENDNIYIQDYENNMKVFYVRSTSGETIVGETRIKAKTGVLASNETKQLTIEYGGESLSNVPDTITVSDNLTFTFVYTKS